MVMVSHPPAPGVGSILPQAAGQASRWGDRDASVSRTILWTRKGPSTTIPTSPPGQVLQHCSPGMWAPRGARSSLWPAPHSQGQATGELHNLHRSSSRPDQGVGLCCVLCRCPKAEHDTSTCASQAIPSFREQHRGLVNVCVVIHWRHLLHHEHAHVSLRIPTVVWKESQSPLPVRVRDHLCFALDASATRELAELMVSADLMVSVCLIPIHEEAGPGL